VRAQAAKILDIVCLRKRERDTHGGKRDIGKGDIFQKWHRVSGFFLYSRYIQYIHIGRSVADRHYCC